MSYSFYKRTELDSKLGIITVQVTFSPFINNILRNCLSYTRMHFVLGLVLAHEKGWKRPYVLFFENKSI